MSDTIQRPSRGDSLKAAWAAKAADMLNRHERELEAASPRNGANLRERRPAPFPYECRVATIDGDPAIVVFAPEGVLTIDDETTTIDTAAAAAGLPAGWFTFEGVEAPAAGESAEVWLRVEFPAPSESESETPSAPTAELTTDAEESGGGSDGESGGNVQRILIARATAHSGGGFRIEQFVRSAIHLSTGGVTSLNGLTGDVTIEGEGDGESASGGVSLGDGRTLRVAVETVPADNAIRISLTDADDSGGDDDPYGPDSPGYCNSISADGDGFSGGGMSDGGNAIADSDGLDNDISRDPCNF